MHSTKSLPNLAGLADLVARDERRRDRPRRCREFHALGACATIALLNHLNRALGLDDNDLAAVVRRSLGWPPDSIATRQQLAVALHQHGPEAVLSLVRDLGPFARDGVVDVVDAFVNRALELPSGPRRASDGKPQYATVLKWSDRNLADRFSGAVVELVRQRHAEALDGGGAP